MTPFALATGNAHKVQEICEIFSGRWGIALAAWAVPAGTETAGFLVSTPGDLAAAVRRLPTLDSPPDVEESGATLEANARIKAVGIGGALGLVAIADDTGLEVDALGGAPGVHSARYAGPTATDADNCEKLLAELRGIGPKARIARFATVALAREPSGREVVATGAVEGRIVDEPRGSGGFGYDPVFAPSEGDGRTFAEMAAAEKHALSHRGRAFRALADLLRPPP